MFTKLLAEAPFGPIPRAVRPMLSTLVAEPFDREGWLFEVKWDGYRAIGQKEQKEIQLYSRNHKSFNQHFPSIVEALQRLKIDTAVFDGEVVALDEAGHPQFQLLQNYFRSPEGDVVYYIFDLLYLDGHDLRQLSLVKRKAILKKVLGRAKGRLRFSDHVEEKGKAFFKEVSLMHLEGMIAKDSQSPYREGVRSREWLKIKTELRQEVVIGGFTQPRGSRKRIGALLIGVYEAKNLKYVGRVGTGFTERSLEELFDLFQPLIQDVCPFKEKFKVSTATWLKPRLVCEVSFAEWTSDDLMRQPVYHGLRIDKRPQEVHAEKG